MLDTSAMTGASAATPGFGFGYGSTFGAPQYIPQGFFSNMLGAVAQPVGSTIGAIFGQPQMGAQVGNVIGGLARFLPFSAVPAPAGMPYGFAAPVPFFPQPVQQQLPFGQQFAPQGFFGDFLNQISQPVGGAVGAFFGQPQLGQQLGGIAGGFAQRLLPFSVGPVGYPTQMAYPQPQLPFGQQFAPQGFWGQGGFPVFASTPFGYPGVAQPYMIPLPMPQAPIGAAPFMGQQPLTSTPVH